MEARGDRELVLLLLLTGIALVVSGISPFDRGTWLMEVAPVFIGVPLLWTTFRRFRLTPLLYRLIFLHALILILGGHYTYAQVPLGFWMQELFDYSTYDAPEIVREVIGFGKPMDFLPPMLIPSVPTMIWGPMIRTVADGLGVELDDITESVERLPLEADVETIQGLFEAGTQGAFRFEVTGIVDGAPRLVVEHVTRISPELVPHWPQPGPGKAGEHRLVIEGRPRIELSIHATDGTDNPADGGNATAAARLVNAIPALVDAAPGVKGTGDLPPVVGGGLGAVLPA